MTPGLTRISFVVLTLLNSVAQISDQEMSSVQKEVWQMEEVYWKDCQELERR